MQFVACRYFVDFLLKVCIPINIDPLSAYENFQKNTRRLGLERRAWMKLRLPQNDNRRAVGIRKDERMASAACWMAERQVLSVSMSCRG
jgi:hypothetical protein